MDETLNKEVKEVVIEQVKKGFQDVSKQKKTLFPNLKSKAKVIVEKSSRLLIKENIDNTIVTNIKTKNVDATSFSKTFTDLASGSIPPIEIPNQRISLKGIVIGIWSKWKGIFSHKKIIKNSPADTSISNSEIATKNLKETLIFKFEQFDESLGVGLSLVMSHVRLFQSDPFLYVWTYPAHAAIAYSLGLWFLTWLSSYSSVDRRQSIIELKKEKTPNRKVRIASKPLPLEINISEETGEAIVSFQSLPSESTVSKEIMESGKGMVRFEPTNFPIAIPDESTLARSSFLFVGADSHSQSSPGIFSRVWQVFFPANSPLTIYATQDQKALIQVGDSRVEDQKQSCSELTKEIRDNCQVKQDNVRLTVQKECTSHVANNVIVAQKQLEKQCKQQIVEKASSYCAQSKKTLDGLETLLESESCSTNATACLNDVKKIVADKGEGNLLDNMFNWML